MSFAAQLCDWTFAVVIERARDFCSQRPQCTNGAEGRHKHKDETMLTHNHECLSDALMLKDTTLHTLVCNGTVFLWLLKRQCI